MGEPAAIAGLSADLGDTPAKIAGQAEVAAYGSGVGTTGIIFAAIAIAWLAYLVPHFARRPDAEASDDGPASGFAASMRIVKHGTAPLLDQDLTELRSYEVSTPQTRRAAVADLRRQERVAARRRRRVLVGLLAVMTAVLAACLLHYLPWVSVAAPAVLLLTFVVVARISVRIMRRGLDARYAAVGAGSDESTVLLSRKDLRKRPAGAPGPTEVDAEGSHAGKLWDPVPITLPTYVSKPLAPRTVRTIDLSGPAPAVDGRVVPVTADAQPEPATPVTAGPRTGSHAVDQPLSGDARTAAAG